MVSVEKRFVVDNTMLIVFIICAGTGVILWDAFPSGYGGGEWNVFSQLN